MWYLEKTKKTLFSKASKLLKCLYTKHLSDFRSTSKTIKKSVDFRPKGLFWRSSKIAETIIYVTFEWFSKSKFGTLKTFEKDDFGSPPSAQMLIYIAPGDFLWIYKTADRGPKRVPKGTVSTPPKNNSKIETELPNALKRLYISCSGTSEPSRKFASEIRGGRSWPKLRFSKKCPRSDFEPLKVDIALGLWFSVFERFLGQVSDPVGPRIGSVGLARGPDRSQRIQNTQLGNSVT